MSETLTAVLPGTVAVRLGAVESVPLGQGLAFKVGLQSIAVFRLRDGRIFALDNRCPHRGGPLAEGLVGSGKVVCPLHAHRFELCSGEGSEPHECVKPYRVWTDNGEIVVELSA
jgi:nitrite reductase (NADH) small subunit